MKLAAILFTLVFGSVTLAGQTASHAQSTQLQAFVPSRGCPVSMHLDQTLGNRIMTVQEGHQTQTYATHLHLTLTPTGPASVQPAKPRSATVTVHAANGHWRVEPVGASAHAGAAVTNAQTEKPPSGEVVKTIQVKFLPSGGRSVATTLWLAGVSPVLWLEVDSIQYTSGTTWKPLPGEVCRVSPNPFELVAAH